MAAPKGNKNGLGNKGGGRLSKKEEEWHLDKWENESSFEELTLKIASGKFSVRDRYLWKALSGNEVILKNMADKILADLHEHSGKGGGAIELSWSSE
jgi:hypothetical protein